MKYKSVNMLQDFEFHDSLWDFVSYDSGKLIVDVRFLNVHSDAAQNPEDCDMEIQLARMTFYGCRIITYEPGVPGETDESGKAFPSETIITYIGAIAPELFINELAQGTTVYSFTPTERGTWYIGGSGDEPFFEAQLSFTGITVEWDEYKGVAWYVEN